MFQNIPLLPRRSRSWRHGSVVIEKIDQALVLLLRNVGVQADSIKKAISWAHRISFKADPNSVSFMQYD